MVMNLIGLTLGFTAFMVLMVQVGYERGFDRNHPTSGRIYRVDKTGTGKDDIFAPHRGRFNHLPVHR